MLAFVGSAPAPTTCLAATPNFKVCFSGHSDGSVIEHDWYASINSRVASEVATPTKLGEWSSWDMGMRPKDPVVSIAVQSTAIWCLTGHKTGLVKLTTSRVDKGTCHARFANHSAAVTGIGLSADERTAVTVSMDASLVVTDLDSGKSFQFRHSGEKDVDNGLRSPFTGLKSAAYGGATVIAATSIDGAIPIWSVRGNSVEPINKLTVAALGRRATAVSWAPDGTSAVVGCIDGTVSKWDLRQMQVPVASATVKIGIERGPETAFKCPQILTAERNRVYSVLALRGDYVAVAAVDGVRIFRWSELEDSKKRQPFSALFASEGVGSMVADETGRFLFAHCCKSAPPCNNTCLGYDLSDVVGLPPPAVDVDVFPSSFTSPMSLDASMDASMETSMEKEADDGLADGLGELLDREVDFSLGEIDFNDDDFFGDFGL
eukprot:m.58943 g.58943  ORF g.58943 m.58943 type:complete len:433 (+) comp9437_c0_seq1:203-1501(+)